MSDFGSKSAGSRRSVISPLSPGLKPFMGMNSTLYDFARSTTIHGIAYIFDRAIQGVYCLHGFFVQR